MALDLYMRHRPSFPDDRHPDVIELSGLLNRLARTTTTTSKEDSFRNANGVAMKLQNFRRLDPSQKGKGLSGGGQGDVEVWTVFAEDPERLRSAAKAIRAAVIDVQNFHNPEPEGEDAEEGRILTRFHQIRERDYRIVERRKLQALRANGALHCEACGFNFSLKYGDRGTGFIECHHAKPVSELQPGERTKLNDLILLCANCHRMVHSRRPWLSLEELRQIIISG
ncbi:HNH endonuclease [Bradyrhizobium sp. 18]|nr:HNH endonuclease [Bradyrhizobium sp. 18]